MKNQTSKWKHVSKIQNHGYIKTVICCDQANQSEVRNIDFKIEPNKADNVFCFPDVFGILQLFISLEPINKYQWGFLWM